MRKFIKITEGVRAFKVGVHDPPHKVYQSLIYIVKEVGPLYGATFYEDPNHDKVRAIFR